MTTDKKAIIQTIRLDPRKLAVLLEDIRANEHKGGVEDARDVDRVWLNTRIIVDFQGKHSSGGRYEAFARNISPKGISFVHGVYVYPDTPCSITIHTRTGEQQCISAYVRRCRHVTGMLHEVGAEFESEIEIEEFVDQRTASSLNAELNADITEATGTVLIIEDCDADQRLIQHHLSKSKLEFVSAKTGAEAIELIDAYPTLVICDLNLPDTNGLDLIKLLRKKGYAGPVIMETGEEMPELKLKADHAGAFDLIIKPCTSLDLRSMVARALAEAGNSPLRGNSAIYSTADPEEMPFGLVQEFVDDLVEIAKKIESSLKPPDTTKMREQALSVKSSALGYGFAPLMHAARNLIKSIDESAEGSKIMDDARVLLSTCRRAAVPDEQTDQAA